MLRGAACCDTHMPQQTAGRGTQTALTHAHICIAHTHMHSTHTHTHVDCTHTCIQSHILQYTCNLVQHEQFNSISIATRNKLCLPSPSLSLLLSPCPSHFLFLPLQHLAWQVAIKMRPCLHAARRNGRGDLISFNRATFILVASAAAANLWHITCHEMKCKYSLR